MENPLVSVIIPVYNVKPYLKECAASVQAQTYTNLQIILVDDGSTDGSGELCDALAKEDARIEVIHKGNGGLSSARNAGLEASKGVYIYFVDSDDWVDTAMVERTLVPMERDGYDQCAWGILIVEEGGGNRSRSRTTPLSLRFPTMKEKQRVLCRWLLSNRIGWSANSRVYRRDLIERNGLRFQNEREIGAEDLDFVFRYFAVCGSFYCIPDRFYNYRQRNNSIMHIDSRDSFVTRELCLLRRQEEILSGQEIFRPLYIYGGITLSVYFDNYIENVSTDQELTEARAAFLSAVGDRDYLEKQARLALRDRRGVLRICGWYLGLQVCAFYRYMLSGKLRMGHRFIWLRQCYERVRSVRWWLQDIMRKKE